MKYVKQLGIILVILFISEILHGLLPIPVPSSIYGLLLLLVALLTGIVKLSQIEATADWLVSIMPVCLIPASVNFIDDWPTLRSMILPILLVSILTTIIIFGVSGRVTQALIRMRKGGKDHE